MAIDRGITRREFLGHTAAALACATPAARAAAAGAPGFYYAYVGTYTPNGGGIYLFRIERASAALGRDGLIEAVSCAGFYGMIGFVLNAFEIPPQPGPAPLT